MVIEVLRQGKLVESVIVYGLLLSSHETGKCYAIKYILPFVVCALT